MIDWVLATLWYGSFLAIVVGLVGIVRPLRRFRLGTRWRGAWLLLMAAGSIVVNARCTPSATSIALPQTKLDVVTPVYHFREVHTRTVDAPPWRVLAAIKSVSADEIGLFALFTAIRRLGRSGPESILNPPAGQPILDVATRTGFILLADDGREVVIGTLVAVPRGFRLEGTHDARWFQELAQAGIAKATMNFLVEGELAERTRVTTETRVFGTDAAVVRRFTPYWRTIFPGSWILRATWLSAIEKRAES